MLTDAEKSRYARQIQLPQLGIEGQQLLKKAKVLVVGAGGLGCPVLQYLTAAGIGHIGIIDADTVDITNLHRQVLYQMQDVGLSKAATAAKHLSLLNPWVLFTVIEQKLTHLNALEIVRQYDIIVDGTDNFAAKYVLNDACIILEKPLVYGSVSQFEGQVSVFGKIDPQQLVIPSLHHLIPFSVELNAIPNCATAGVIGALPGIVGSIQALEVIKIITKIGEPLVGKVLVIDALTMEFQTFQLDTRQTYLLTEPIADYEKLMKSNLPTATEITAFQVKSWLDSGVQFQLVDVRHNWESEICSLGGFHIPLAQLQDRIKELNPALPTVFYCHHGIRSFSAVRLVEEYFNNEANCYSMQGGIETWALEIDQSISRY